MQVAVRLPPDGSDLVTNLGKPLPNRGEKPMNPESGNFNPPFGVAIYLSWIVRFPLAGFGGVLTMLSNQFRCSDCGSLQGFRSRPRTAFEKYLLPIFLLRPVRCAKCFRRDYRLLFLRVLDRFDHETTRHMAA